MSLTPSTSSLFIGSKELIFTESFSQKTDLENIARTYYPPAFFWQDDLAARFKLLIKLLCSRISSIIHSKKKFCHCKLIFNIYLIKVEKYIISLKLQSLTLLLLVTTQLKVLTSLQRQLSLGLADNTLQSQNNLLGNLGFLVENWLSLTTVTSLLTVISSLTLGKKRSLTSLVLGNPVLGVFTAVLTLAIGLSGLWDVN